MIDPKNKLNLNQLSPDQFDDLEDEFDQFDEQQIDQDEDQAELATNVNMLDNSFLNESDQDQTDQIDLTPKPSRKPKTKKIPAKPIAYIENGGVNRRLHIILDFNQVTVPASINAINAWFNTMNPAQAAKILEAMMLKSAIDGFKGDDYLETKFASFENSLESKIIKIMIEYQHRKIATNLNQSDFYQSSAITEALKQSEDQ